MAALARRVLVAILSLSLLTGPGLALSGVAFADEDNPTAAEVEAAREAAEAKAEAAGQAKAKLALADARLRALRLQTAQAVAAFKAAEARLAVAQRAAARATLDLHAAGTQVEAQRQTIITVATSTYRSGGSIGMWSTLLSADGPATFLQSAGAITAISTRQANALGRLKAARVAQALAQQKAAAALSTVQTATDEARAARDRAARAVDDQQRERGEIAEQKAVLAGQAENLDAEADQLARTREINLERARAAAAAARQRAALGNGQVSQENPVAITGGPRPIATAAQGRAAVEYAKAQLGKPYQWGAAGPNSFDCSGLTMMAWRHAGIGIDHYSVAQYGEGVHVSRAQLRPGDLVFFAYNTSDASTIHHVGIYTGGGMMIEAPFTGANVRYSPAFRSDYIGATRP